MDNPVDRALASTVSRHEIPRELLEALIDGFAWDADGRRYRSLSDLSAYAARVAGTVGAMMAVLMGTRAPEAVARACDLGVAMQLTNIARDVGEDARAGRLYLPLDWLDEAGVDAHAFLATPAYSSELGSVIERLLGYANTLYWRADLGISMLPVDCRSGIRAASLIYAEIGAEIARREFNSVSARVVVSGRRKFWLLLSSFLGRWPDVGCAAAGTAPALTETQFLVDATLSTEAPERELLTKAGG